MDLAHFIRIEREENGTTRHFVVHTTDPKFSLEIIPDLEAGDHHGKGVIKAVRVPNSWAGNYGQYAKFLAAAQEFFARSFAAPSPKEVTRRFQL